MNNKLRRKRRNLQTTNPKPAEDPRPRNETQGTTASDPVNDLLTGIAFRNGGRAEAARRIRGYVYTQAEKIRALEERRTKEALQMSGDRLREVVAQVERLRQIIRTMKMQQAEALIEAARPNVLQGENFKTTEALRG